MNDLYAKSYFDHRNWLLDNAENFNLSPEAFLLCLIFDYCNQYHIPVTYELMSHKLNLAKDQIDQAIQELVDRNYLNIYIGENGIIYDITKIFHYLDALPENFDDDLFRAFEVTFKRPLNTTELQKLSDFINEYSHEEILAALRNAEAYKKCNFAYIETILHHGKDESQGR